MPPQGGCDWQCGPPQRSQLSEDDFALHLQADDEEKYRHQRIVDPVLQRMLQLVLAPGKTNIGFPETEIRIRSRGIRQNQRGHGAQQQHNPTGSFHMQKPIQRTGHGMNWLAGKQTGLRVVGINHGLATLRKVNTGAGSR